MVTLIRVLSTLSLVTLLFWQNVGNATEYTIGIVPQQHPKLVKQMWCPFINRLSEKTGHSITFKTNNNFEEFEAAMARGEYDFAYLNPLQYIKFNKAQGYKAFAKDVDKNLRGVIVVPNNSSCKTLEQLNGKEIAFPDRKAFAASMVVQRMLQHKNIKYTPVYVGSHQKVYDSVASELYEVGGGIEQSFDSSPSNIRNKLKVLWQSDPYPSHVFVAHGRVPRDVVESVYEQMVDFSENDNEKIYLDLIHLDGIGPAKDIEWNEMRSENWGVE